MNHKENIYITGFMGSGKTTLGRRLAKVLGRPFADLDSLLAKHFGKSIPRVFAEDGEEAFRRAESQILERLTKKRGQVAATGGGLPLDPENRRRMRESGRVLFLDAGLEACRARLGEVRDDRPLWKDPAAVAKLYQSRREAYADHDICLPAGDLDPEGLTEAALAALWPRVSFRQELDGHSAPVRATFQAPLELSRLTAGRRVALLTERRVAKLHAGRYGQALRGAVRIVVAPGEGSKSLKEAEAVYKAMLEARLERGDLLVALGGGMITDLGAFVASTYKRGMEFVLVSTTLLGAVDASVGGKAAVNLSGYKNVVGSFTLPREVILDLFSLSTLPRAQRAEGLVEAYKTGLVAGPELASLVEEHAAELLSGDLALMAKVAADSARIKASVVAGDFREKGNRRILNLGHTYGHALEGWHRYRISHGRSVAEGSRVALRLSLNRGLMQAETARRIDTAFRAIFPAPLEHPPLEAAWDIMQNDKKNAGGRVVFVLLEGPGRPVVVDDLTREELARALTDLGEQDRG